MKTIITIELFFIICINAVSQSTVDLPYQTSFESETDFENEWTIENVNEEGDGTESGFWIYSPDYFGIDASGSVVFISSSINNADDWLYSPGFELVADVEYSLSFSYASLFSGYPASLEVYFGASNSHTEMSNLIYDFGPYDNPNFSEYSTTINVETGGIYYIGFHDYSPIGGYGGETIDDFTISQTPLEVYSQGINKIEIYPNPASDYITINQDYKSYKIFNSNGVVVKSGEYSSQIPLDSLNDGVFFIMFEFKDQTYSSYKFSFRK